MPKTKTTKGVKLHVVEGVVYAADDRGSTEAVSPQALEGWVSGKDVFAFGNPDNAALLVRLYLLAQSEGGPKKIYVAAPPGWAVGIRPRPPRGKDPEAVRRAVAEEAFQAMDPVRHGAGGPGWHAMVEPDLAVYKLLSGHGDTLLLTTQHPAWPYLAFVRCPDHKSAASLLRQIVDPRWFWDAGVDGMDLPAFRYLGISGDSTILRIRNVIYAPEVAQQIYSQYYPRITAVLGSWARGEWLEDPGKADVDDPRNYLWKLVLRESDRVAGIASACRAFVRVLLDWWTHAMLPHRPPLRDLFIPEYSFNDLRVAAAWKEFYAAFREGPVP